MIRDARGGTSTLSGRILSATLREVIIEIEGKERSVASDRVLRLTLGAVPAGYEEGLRLFQSGDYANAVSSYRLVAADGGASKVVQASAGAQALEAGLRLAGRGEGDFAALAIDAGRFISSQSDSRELPAVRSLEARALWLSNQAGEAGKRYEALFGELQGATTNPGYDLVECLRCGWLGSLAKLDAGDVAGARKLGKALESALPAALAELAADDPRRARLEALAQGASQLEGFALLADKKASQAKTFFKSAVDGSKPSDLLQRTVALVGLGESHAAQGEWREARLAFARAFATGADQPEFLCRALAGQAWCALELAESNSKEQARRWLEGLGRSYGTTPAARRGLELAKRL
jgi:tetratricopeptide (TPR) repeat protein